MVAKWLYGNLFWPTLQSMAGAGVCAIAIAGTNQAGQVVSGCPVEVAETIVNGEIALAERDTARAMSFAEDGLASAPHSSCSNAFAAAAEMQLMADLFKVGKQAEAERYRVKCFHHANLAAPLIGAYPRVNAIREVCRAR